MKNKLKKPIFNLSNLDLKDSKELFAVTVKNKNYLKKFLNWAKEDYKLSDVIKFIKESTRKIITEGFKKLYLKRIGLRCATCNKKSCAIPKRLGFKKEGILRQSALLENKFCDMEIWSILKEEWK